MPVRKLAVAAVAIAAAYAAGPHPAAPARPAAAAAGSPAAAKAIAYARGQLGRPYVWGGPTAPGTSGGFDCSGLVMMAWRAAGITIARTSQDQWATEPHVSRPRPGDLAFFAGADGSMTRPGHVGIVIGGGRMIEAYGTGYPVRVASWHRPDLVGFTDPSAGGSP